MAGMYFCPDCSFHRTEAGPCSCGHGGNAILVDPRTYLGNYHRIDIHINTEEEGVGMDKGKLDHDFNEDLEGPAKKCVLPMGSLLFGEGIVIFPSMANLCGMGEAAGVVLAPGRAGDDIPGLGESAATESFSGDGPLGGADADRSYDGLGSYDRGPHLKRILSR